MCQSNCRFENYDGECCKSGECILVELEESEFDYEAFMAEREARNIHQYELRGE